MLVILLVLHNQGIYKSIGALQNSLSSGRVPSSPTAPASGGWGGVLNTAGYATLVPNHTKPFGLKVELEG